MGKINKQKMLLDKCRQIVGAILYEPELVKEVRSKIPVEYIPETYRELFERLYRAEELDQEAVYHIIRLTGFSLQDFSEYSKPQNINMRIVEFFDLYDSIKTENVLRERLSAAEGELKGLDLLSQTIEELKTEQEKYSRFEKPKEFVELIEETINKIEEEIKGNRSLYKTKNFPTFNNCTSGISEGNLIGIAGAYKSGKTTLAVNLVLDFISQGIPSAIFSLEMTRTEVVEKILSIETGLPYHKLRNPKLLTDAERADLIRSKKKLSDKRLFVFDNLHHFSDIENKIKQLAENEGVKIVVIDYIGLIRQAFKYKSVESREREISMLSSNLKLLAKETSSVIIVLSQLNRSGIRDASSINLAESIGLARDSDFLFTIFNPCTAGIRELTEQGKKIYINNNHYLVTLDSSRHSQSGIQFILQLEESGLMKELTFDYPGA